MTVKAVDDIGSAVDRAIERAQRSRSQYKGPYAVSWLDRQIVAVIDPETFATSEPEQFAAYLCSTRVERDHWELRKLLPKKLRDTLPGICPAVAVEAAIKSRGYWYHGSSDGLMPQD